jgi:hypothetical protein
MTINIKNISKALPAILIALTFSFFADAQKLTAPDFKKLQLKEDSLKKMATNFLLDSFTAGRMRSDSQFIKTFIRGLQVKNSFYYPFDSLEGVAKIYAPDSTFRIYTWNLAFDEYYSRQRGAIQFRTKDGSLKLVPLRDYSEFTEKPMDSVRTARNWIGAVYYNIVKTDYNGKNYYTLFGFENSSQRTNMKWIEVLTFNAKNEPVFGGPFFSFAEDSIKRPVQYRYNMEYKKEARAVIEYDAEQKVIIVDHLISESDEPENKWTYVPDGDYEAFEWKNGKWMHIDKLYNFKLEDGQAPMPDPIRDGKGTTDEKKLQDQSEKNKVKKKDN